MSIILLSLTNLVVLGKEFVYMSIMFCGFSFSVLSRAQEGRVSVNFFNFVYFLIFILFRWVLRETV